MPEATIMGSRKQKSRPQPALVKAQERGRIIPWAPATLTRIGDDRITDASFQPLPHPLVTVEMILSDKS
jgi:hypothetical protein